MNKAVFIAPYLIRIKNDDLSWINSCLMGDLQPGGTDFFALLQQYLTSRQAVRTLNVIEKRSSKVKEFTADNQSRSIDGLLQFGDYGYATEIQDVITDDKKKRSVNDCEYQPLYFRIEIPANSRLALLLLQRSGPHGCKTHLEDDLRSYLQGSINRELNIRIVPYTDKDYLKSIITGQVKKIRYIKNTIPTDIADKLLSSSRAKNGHLELVLKIRDGTIGSLVSGLGNIFKGRELNSGVLEINNVVYDRVKIDFENNGRSKSVSLAKLDKLTMDLDITRDIKRGDDGHPTIETLRSATQIILDGIAKKLGWRLK